MLETQKTALDPRHGGSRFSRGRGIKLALGLAIAILCIALVTAVVRNFALQKRVAHAERVADERAGEIREMSRQCGIAARVSLEKLSDSEGEESPDDQAEEEPPALGAGIDGSVPSKVERW